MKNRNPHKTSCVKWYTGPSVIFFSLGLLIISVFVFFAGIPYIIKENVKAGTQLVEGSEALTKWSNVTVPVYLLFYYFNVTNPDAVIQNGSKFDVNDVGPYTWEEKRTKQVVAVDEEEDTLTFTETISYHFRRDLSVGSQDDRINMVNIPFISFATQLYTNLYPFWADAAIELLISEGESVVLRDVNLREITFDGMKLKSSYQAFVDLGSLTTDIPPEFKDGAFALYGGRNRTPTKEFKIYRGVKNHKDFGKVLTYDGKKEVWWWTNKSLPEGSPQYCNHINGTDGQLIPPFVPKERLRLFSADVCRSAYLEFESEISYRGVRAYQFKPPRHTEVPEDERCFCIDPGHKLDNKCRVGVGRLYTCTHGSPVVISNPHFVGSPDEVINGVVGLKPNRSAHETTMIIEPLTGAILYAIKRVQASVEYQPMPNIAAFENVHHTFVPILWIEEIGEIDGATLDRIRSQLITPMEIVSVVQWIVVGVLALLLIVGIAMTWKNRRGEVKPLPLML